MSQAFAAVETGRTKSPEAFRTISEVSSALDVPQHVLRFWETRFAQVRPIKRAGGRRFYRPEDVALLRGIRSLLYSDGYTIKGVQKVLRDKGWRHVAELGRKLAETAADTPAWSAIPEDGALAEDGFYDGASTSDGLYDPETPAVGAGSTLAAVRVDPAAVRLRNVTAMATLLRVHADASLALAEQKRVKLELLLAELLVLRDKLYRVRGKA